jgi:hypothetical protein
MINALQRLILVDEGSKGQLLDIIEKLTIRQGQLAVGELSKLSPEFRAIAFMQEIAILRWR